MSQNETIGCPARPVRQGIMVFSSSYTILYANRDAHYFIKRLNQEGYGMDGALPVVIMNLFDKMKRTLETRPADSDGGGLEAKRLILGHDPPIVLRIFGLPDRLRVVIKMEELAPVEADSPEVIPPSPHPCLP